MLYHIELFAYTLITILFTIYLTFGIGMAKFLGFQNRGFVEEKFTDVYRFALPSDFELI